MRSSATREGAARSSPTRRHRWSGRSCFYARGRVNEAAADAQAALDGLGQSDNSHAQTALATLSELHDRTWRADGG